MPAADDLALYIHWPFCLKKCPYCDFNSHVRDTVDAEAWQAALLADMAHEHAVTSGRRVGSIFFGGEWWALSSTDQTYATISASAALYALSSRGRHSLFSPLPKLFAPSFERSSPMLRC